MGYVENGQPGPGPDSSWVENAIHTVADWAASLFGGQADERNRRRIAQNEAAFRGAAQGGTADLAFLKARSGRYGTLSIPVHLPYAVSPSSGEAETPGNIGGWATGPAQRHAAALLDSLDSWGGPPGSIPDVDPSIVDELYDLARTEGRDVAEAALTALAAAAWGALPDEYRQAVERGVRDHYLGSTPVKSAGIGVLAAVGLGLALMSKRGR